ncbi:recombinase family protein [Gorillibacterium sp. sgz5001074]|uniref:recombinase family protein n=1 Tax=Gorillibacterium sp. sgz5001074 TaxID=3446695 RepID=UPI003F66E3E4
MNRLKNLDVALYLRKSQADIQQEREATARGEAYDTLGKHRTELLSICKRDEHNVLDLYEEVVSGDMIAARPEMQKLLENINRLKYDAVLVVDIDRLGRGDKMDQGLIERAFRRSGTLIITPTDTYDMNEESGEFSVEVKTFLARMEYKQIKKRLLNGKKRSAREGKNMSTKPPYGYMVGKDLKLIINEEEAKIVRLMFQWCLDGLGRVAIADRLTEMGIPNPSGRREWSHVTVRKILDNPKYTGDQVYGRVKWTKQDDGRYTTKKINDPSLLTVVEGAHEAIIDKPTFDKVADLIKSRVKVPVRQDHEQVNAFATLLRCKKCGKAMLANNPSNRPNIYIYCDSHNRCGQKMVALNKVEEVVLSQLEQILEQLKRNTRYREKKKQDDELVANLAEKRVEKLKEELTKAHKRKNRLHDLLEDDTYTKDEFLERMKAVQEQVKQVEADLTQAEEKVIAIRQQMGIESKTIPAIEHILEVLRTSKSAKEKNIALKSVIKEIRYNREKEWKGPYEFELEIELS